MQIYDISRALSACLAVWPGDTPFRFDLKWKMTEGAAVNVGAITSSVHNGTHADAFFHFEANGNTIERMPLDAYLGAAVVSEVAQRNSSTIGVDHLWPVEPLIRETQRLLLKTNAWPEPAEFPAAIPIIAQDVPAWLSERGVKLLGVDVPSVDAIDSKTLPNHHALAQAHIAIVEGLDLSRVAPGVYQLVALPLKIAGADGAPVRAVLWRS